MGDLIEFLKKKQQRSKKKQTTSSKKPPDAQSIRLWRFSMEIDDLIKKGVVHDSLSPDEIAAVLAHRLGTLISCCDQPVELARFCNDIIDRLNLPKPKTGEPA